MQNHRFRAIWSISVVFTYLFGMACIAKAQTSTAKLTAAQWQADVRFLGDELPRRHRNAFHRMKREDFESAVNKLYSAVPTMSDDEIVVELMKLVAMIKDGHTNLIPMQYFQSGAYPLRFYSFADGVYVEKAAPAYAELVGAKVLRVGIKTIDDAMTAIAPVIAADNEMGVLDIGPMFLSAPEILSGLKIISDKKTLDLVVSSGGKERSVTVHPEATVQNILSPPSEWVDAAGKKNAPLYLTHSGETYWFEYLKDKQIVYVKQNAVQNKPNETLADFYKKVFEFIDANPVDKLVIDLRNNGGGNNTLNTPIIVNMIRSKINKRGHLFVITGRQTFSAAQNFTNQIEKWTEAIFVGEPTADHVNMYGDNRPFTLPNSGLVVRASTLWWQDLDPRDERKWKAPDIAADLTFADYAAGRDPAFQAILDYKPGSTLSEIIQTAASTDSLGDFTQRFRAIKADPKSRYVNVEDAMNRLGYTLLAKKRNADAVEVFRLNAESYPTSANVYDSLGDALVAAGLNEEAIKSYEKAVAIDPGFQTSIDALKRLRKN